jgi:hypothetical protein
MSDFPTELQINAFAGDADNHSPFEPTFAAGLLQSPLPVAPPSLAPPRLDYRDWSDDRVGWGIVLPEDPTRSSAEKAVAIDAPASVRAVLEKRRGVVLRREEGRPPNRLRRHYPDGTSQEINVTAQSWGTGRGKVPRYLMMLGSPDVLPWSVQYQLQGDAFVGRVALEGDALDRYLGRLLDDWSTGGAAIDKPLVWSTAQSGDITRLMRDCIGAPLYGQFKQDVELTPTFIDGATGEATGALLAAALAASRPGFIATTSHGMTGPLADPAKMKAALGLLVDSDLRPVATATLTSEWEPDGTIWYAHACCSAGSQSATSFKGLVVPGSSVDRILSGVAACGDTMAPLPQALLSAPKPAKAFVGHVEPTFDWSVRQNDTGQFLTNPLLDSFYQRLFSGEPIGMALDSCRRMAAGLLSAALDGQIAQFEQGQSTAGDILATKLMAVDWRAFVLIGDPACRL